MFIENKYTRWYFSIISNARENVQQKEQFYCERHHIIPKSCGGSNDPQNIVKLSAREHFICHLLLCRMLENPLRYKMIFAAKRMCSNKGGKAQRNYKISSRIFETLRKETAIAISVTNKGKLKGAPKSEETKRKISEANKGKIPSQETKQKLSQAQKIRVDNTNYDNPFSGEKGSKMSSENNLRRVKEGTNPWAGEIGSQQSKDICKRQLANGTHPFLDKEAASKRSLKRLAEGTHPFLALNNVQWQCPHCGAIGKGKSNANRWHFDKCKNKFMHNKLL